MDNYRDTAYCMYEDVQILHEKHRWFNCCYLAGYVVECYSKLLLDNAISSGITTQKGAVKDYGHNINVMKIDLINILSISTQILSKYCIDLNLECNSIITEWNPNKRYEAESGTWSQEEKANAFKHELEIVINQIKNMQLDGVI